MNAHLGMHVLRRSALATFGVMLLLVFVLATKLMMSGVPLSASVLGLLTAMQLPHVVIFACGLGTYWLIDEWVGNETWALISTTGVSRRRLAAAVLAPGMIALWMLVFNVTAFRKAIADAGRALASVQLEDAGRAMARAGVLQVGPLRLRRDRPTAPACTTRSSRSTPSLPRPPTRASKATPCTPRASRWSCSSHPCGSPRRAPSSPCPGPPRGPGVRDCRAMRVG